MYRRAIRPQRSGLPRLAWTISGKMSNVEAGEKSLSQVARYVGTCEEGKSLGS